MNQNCKTNSFNHLVLHKMIMQKKAERRRRRREEARNAAAHQPMEVEADDQPMEQGPKESAALPPNRPSPKMAAARHASDAPYQLQQALQPQQVQHQSSFTTGSSLA